MSVCTSLHPTYNLRPNKAIDRLLLVDLLRHVPYESRRRYEYIGLGGPFLEDFKVMHHYYPEIALTSIEANADTYKRQKFNKTSRAIKLVAAEIATYFEEHGEFKHPLIVWFDGTDFRQRTIENLISIVSKLPIGSIFKVTARVSFETEPRYKVFAENVINAINAYLPTVDDLTDVQRTKLSTSLKRILDGAAAQQDEMSLAMQQVTDYLPEGHEQMLDDQPSRAKLYFQILQKAILSVYPSTGDTLFHLISSNYYSDGTTMISITGMLIRRSSLTKVKRIFRDYKTQGDQLVAPEKIDIPILSVKERMELDPHLPLRKNIGKKLHELLGFRIDSSGARTEAQLEFYNSYHQYYPFFSKIQL